jgi:hypothetical protein
MRAQLVDSTNTVVATTELDQAGRAWGGRADPDPQVIVWRGVAYVRDDGDFATRAGLARFHAAPTLMMPLGYIRARPSLTAA